MALFVDFKKSFDLINPKLLLLKLFQYGFNNSSLNIFRDYFKNRLKVRRVQEIFSQSIDITIGVPQGSLLRPLLFLIYINDMSISSELESLLFADNTTLDDSGNELDQLKSDFKRKLLPL